MWRVGDDFFLAQFVEGCHENRPLHAEESIEVFQFADDLYVGGAALREAQNPKCQPFLDIARIEGQESFKALLLMPRNNIQQVDK